MQTTSSSSSGSPDSPVWAIIELMGHNRYGGLVSKDAQFGTAMLRVEVPQKDGTFISQLINPSSIYRITLASEELARHAAAMGDPKPLNAWEMPHLTTTADPEEDPNNQ